MASDGAHVDAMRFVTGDIHRLFAVVATQAKQWLGGRHNKAKMAELSQSRLCRRGHGSPQCGRWQWSRYWRRVRHPAARHAAKGGNTLAPMPVPERFTLASPGTPSGEAINVGQIYTLFARAIRDGETHHPTFETAVELHRLVDATKQSSDNGREVTFG